jgi:hypothetical protein
MRLLENYLLCKQSLGTKKLCEANHGFSFSLSLWLIALFHFYAWYVVEGEILGGMR